MPIALAYGLLDKPSITCMPIFLPHYSGDNARPIFLLSNNKDLNVDKRNGCERHARSRFLIVQVHLPVPLLTRDPDYPIFISSVSGGPPQLANPRKTPGLRQPKHLNWLPRPLPGPPAQRRASGRRQWRRRRQRRRLAPRVRAARQPF